MRQLESKSPVELVVALSRYRRLKEEEEEEEPPAGELLLNSLRVTCYASAGSVSLYVFVKRLVPCRPLRSRTGP